MPDDRTIRGPADASRINIHEPYELNYWCKHLGVTPDELRRAVQNVGPMVVNVRRFLGK